jgi:F-type H+-transporting ATPase subunit delta
MPAVARRYAQALFSLAQEKQRDPQQWLEALRLVARLADDPEVHALLDAPKVPLAEKRRVVEEALADFDPLCRNFVYVLIERHRFEPAFVHAVVDEFERLVLAAQGVVVATVQTAVDLTDEEKERLARRLETLVGKRVVLRHQVNPRILGGVVVRIDDQLIDASVAGRLAALRQHLVEAG